MGWQCAHFLGRTFVTLSDGRQVEIRCLLEGLVFSPGLGCHQKTLKDAWSWLMKQPAIRVTPLAAAKVSPAHWPLLWEEMSVTSAGFSMATKARAVGSSFSQDSGLVK